MDEVIVFLKDWVIPLGATGLSIWFASSAKKDSERSKQDSERAQEILNEIKQEIQGSQRKMIESSIGILDSLPQVISGKSVLSITKAIESALNTIKENVSNPQGLPKEQHDQNMLALSSHLSMLLDQLKSFTK